MAMKKTLAQLQAENPRRQGENPLAYQQRLGQLEWAQNGPPVSVFAPQGGDETGGAYALRSAVGTGASAAKALGNEVVSQSRQDLQNIGGLLTNDLGTDKLMAGLFSTPNERKAQAAAAVPSPARAFGAPAAGAGPINSYQDPRWTGMEQDVEKLAGLPAGSLGLIRTKGERSNNDQVSSAGARTVYQITPTTRQLIMNKYGFDPYSSPSNAAKGAAMILKEGMDRTGTLEGGVRQYIGGTDPRNYGSTTAAYVQRVMGGVGEAGGFTNPFDPKYAEAALGALGQGERAAMAPQTMEYTPDTSTMPQMPALEKAPAQDFSKGDAAIAALKPAEISEKEQLQIRRQGYMEGIGKALLNLEDGAGLGKVLAALGGGALAGSAGGDRELRSRMDRFDDLNARYNVALAGQENMKAQQLQQQMQHETDVTNARNVQQFGINLKRWEAQNFGSVTPDGSAFITSKSGPDGKVTVTRTPIAAAVQADFAVRRAGLLAGISNQYNEGAGVAAKFRNQLIASAAVNAITSPEQDTSAAGVVTGLAGMAGDIVSTGGVARLFGSPDDDSYKSLLKDVQQSLVSQGIMPGSQGYDEQFRQAMSERLVRGALTNPKFRDMLVKQAGPAQAVMGAMRDSDKKTTVTRGPKGTTVREQY